MNKPQAGEATKQDEEGTNLVVLPDDETAITMVLLAVVIRSLACDSGISPSLSLKILTLPPLPSALAGSLAVPTVTTV